MNTEIAILTASVTATATSAWETLLEVDARARKDYRKIHRFLTSEEVREALQWGAAIALALGAVAFVLGQEFRSWCDRLVESSLEQEEATEEDARCFADTARVALLPDARPLTVGEVVRWQRPLVTAPVEVVEAAPVARPIHTQRARIEALFAQAEELRKRELEVDAKIFTVAQVAVNSMLEEADAIARRWA